MKLQNLLGVLRKRGAIVVVTATIVVLVAFVISVVTPRTYQSDASILVTQQNVGTVLLGSPQTYQSDQALQRDIQTQVDVMQSPVILGKVIESLGLDTSVKRLADRVRVTFNGATNIVTVSVTASTPDAAAATANAIASSYVDWSRERQRASIRAASADVQTRLAAAQKRIVQIQAEISSGDKSGSGQVELKAAQETYASLANKLEDLNINEQLSTGSGSVLTSATPSPVPASPKPVRNAALGLALGLMLGLGIAFVTEALDNTIKSTEVCEEIFGAPVLCTIPMEKRSKDAPRGIALIEDPGGSAAEAYRILRNNLGFINFEHDIKTVLVTSALPDEGKSTVAANLAAVLARTGKNVVLVSCDFHRPGSAQLFDLSGTFGLSDILRGTIDAKQVLEHPKGLDLNTLWVIPAGSKPPNPSEILGSSAMGALITSLAASSDWVILDSPPMLVLADAAATARWADGALVVVRANKSTRASSRRMVEQLRNVGSRIFGEVMWGLSESVAPGGYSNYGMTSSARADEAKGTHAS